MTDQKPCRADLLNWINIVSFTVDDVKLFLDTHPHNQEALCLFEEYKCLRNKALKEYAKYYGPLTVDTADTPSDYWNWVKEPWPWQMGGC